MYWNYRVVKKQYPRNEDDTVDDSKPEFLGYSYGVHEVYYDAEGRANMVTKEPQEPSSETVEELIASWAAMAEAFTKPILDFDAIPEEDAINELGEAMKELQDDDGNIRPTEELEAEGKLISHEVVMSDLRERLGLEDFDMKEYRNEQIVEQNKSEAVYNEVFVGKALPEAFIEALRVLKESNWIHDDDEEEEEDAD